MTYYVFMHVQYTDVSVFQLEVDGFINLSARVIDCWEYRLSAKDTHR